MIQSFFEWKKKQFLKKKSDYLNLARQWRSDGYEQDAIKLLENIEKLQQDAEQISLHYVTGGNSLQKKTFLRVYKFWSNLSNLEESTKSIWKQLFEAIFFVGGTVFLVKRFWFTFYTVPTGSAEPNMLVGDRICGVRYPYLFKKPERGDLIIFDKPNFNYDSNPIKKIYQKYIGFPLLGILPAGPDSWTKRVVAVPGDRVALKINEAGKAEVWLNGNLLDEPYLNPYPVIWLKRDKGFIEKNNPVFQIPFIGGFLRFFDIDKKTVKMFYTFDPKKPYNQQPFYNFEEKEVVKNAFTGRPMILYPDKADPRLDRMAEMTIPEGWYLGLGDNRKNSDDCRNWGLIHEDLIVGRASFIIFSIDGTETYWFIELLKNPIKFFTQKIRWSRFFRFVHPFKGIPKN